MWLDILLVSIFGGLVALDTTAILQIMISRPIVACTIVGLILGNVQLGLTIGILLELIYVGELPIGAAKFAEGNVGSTAAAAIAMLTISQIPDRKIIAIGFVLIVTFIISMAGGLLVIVMRKLNSKIYDSLINKEKITFKDVSSAHLYGIASAFFLGFLCVFVSVSFFSFFLPRIIHLIPPRYDSIFHPIMGGILGTGCIFLAQIFWNKNEHKWLLLLGIGIGALYFI